MAPMNQGMDTSQEMRAWISPSLIEANHILSLSQQSLQELIQREMAENPALELESLATCPVCQSPLEGFWCPTCQRTIERERSEQSLDSMDEYEVASAPSAPEDSSTEFDPMTVIATDQDPVDLLREDAHISLHAEDHPIADIIIDSLDERGFLTMSIEEIASHLQLAPQDVAEVLSIIQQVAPIGVGARSLQECLLLQIAFLKELGTEIPPHTEEVVRDSLDDLGAHKFGLIQKQLGLSSAELDGIREFVRNHLSPFPLQNHSARNWQSPSHDGHITPDVIIEIVDHEIQVRIADNHYFHLRTNALYQQLAQDTGSASVASSTHQPVISESASLDHTDNVIETQFELTSTADRNHVRSHTQRALLFMNNINQRQSTLLRISDCICRFQEDFLREGVRELHPLTRATVAQEVGVHESTVSRATANKFAQLPNRKVIPFADFFTANLSAKEAIREIIERFAKSGNQVTDKRIVELLEDEGIRIARRTVAKYRAELGILPSNLRQG